MSLCVHCSWEHYGNSRLSKIEAITKKTLPQIHCIRTDAANLEHESESTNLPALFLLMIHARRLFYTAAIFFLWSPLFPILNLVKVFAIVSCWDWAVRTVLSRSNLASIEWGSRPQKNGWVANSLGEQTNTTQPARVQVKCLGFCFFTSWAIIHKHFTFLGDKIKVWFDGQ